jgi:hypothetical protein
MSLILTLILQTFRTLVLAGVPKMPDMGAPAIITAHLTIMIEPPAVKTCDVNTQ